MSDCSYSHQQQPQPQHRLPTPKPATQILHLPTLTTRELTHRRQPSESSTDTAKRRLLCPHQLKTSSLSVRCLADSGDTTNLASPVAYSPSALRKHAMAWLGDPLCLCRRRGTRYHQERGLLQAARFGTPPHPPSARNTILTNLPDPFAEADEDTGGEKQSQNYIHIRIQRTSSLLVREATRPAQPVTKPQTNPLTQSATVARP